MIKKTSENKKIAQVPEKKKITRKKWNVEKVRALKLEINEKEYKKRVEVIADIFYHHICQLQKDQNNSKNSIELSTAVHLNDAA
jgi:hypothetical protein